jgi:1,6-anhydro-N-acetylmuramate kinase
MPERVITAIGLTGGALSGGVDVALVVTDGEARIVRRQSLTFPFERRKRPAEAETELTRFCANAVKHFLESFAVARDAVALIGFHAAEALRPEPEPGEALARATGIDVVYDFATADRQAGGQGEPLEPVYHRALADAAGLARPLAVVEMGDVATVTFIGEDGNLAVFSAGRSASPEAIAEVRQSLPARPLLWLLAGEESRRDPLFEALSGLFPEPVHRAEEMGWSMEHFEAEAYAYLAVRSVRRLPLTFPGTTGVKAPVTGGRLARAPRR